MTDAERIRRNAKWLLDATPRIHPAMQPQSLHLTVYADLLAALDRLEAEVVRLREGWQAAEDKAATYLARLGNKEDGDEAEITRLREAVSEAHGILQYNLGDVDPHVRSACDILWSALTSDPARGTNERA